MNMPDSSTDVVAPTVPLVWFVENGGSGPASANAPSVVEIRTDPDVVVITVSATDGRQTIDAVMVARTETADTWLAALAFPTGGEWSVRAEVTAISPPVDLTDSRYQRLATQQLRVGPVEPVEPDIGAVTSPGDGAAISPNDGAATPAVRPAAPPPPPGPPVVTVECYLESPPANAVITGAEPGDTFTVTGYASAKLVYPNGVSFPLIPRVSVGVDGAVYLATVAAGGTWTATCRVYHQGTVTITARATASTDQGNGPVVTATRQVQVSLASPLPSLTVVAPSAGAVVGLGEAGGQVTVTANMADATQFGNHIVVAQPDYGVPVTLAPVAGSTIQFSGPVPISPMPLGSRQITVTGTCAVVNVSNVVGVTVTGVDIGAPHVQVTHPNMNGVVAATPTAAGTSTYTVSISGTATDTQSGMVGGQASVQVATSVTGLRVAARPTRPGDFTGWTVDALPVPAGPAPTPGTIPGSLGIFPLFVWATDNVGTNTVLLQWGFEAVRSWVPQTVDERLSSLVYLSDLITFAGRQVVDDTNVAVSPAQLRAVLAQPIDTISQPATTAATAAQLPVNELWVPIEVLRADLAQRGVTAGASGQAAYLTAAYQALLAGVGTSYAELRMARGAPPDTRTGLAERLGIPLYGASSSAPRPDQLDALTLVGNALTDAALNDVFGLADSTAAFDPGNTNASAQRLLGWRVEAQRSGWQAQDARATTPVAYTVVVDPDIITTADLVSGSALYATVSSLLSSRRQLLTFWASYLTSARAQASGDPDGGFAKLVAAALLGVDIAALHAQDLLGVDIAPKLAGAGLDRIGFDYLVQLQALATAGGSVVTDAEWADAVDVLVGAFRRHGYRSWQLAEAQAGILLSPDIFQSQPEPAPVNPLRIDPRARRDWDTTLRTRCLERQSLLDEHAGLLSSTERVALPVLRDALLHDLATSAHDPTNTGDPTQVGEFLSASYQIDLLVSGALQTTRMDQAITSMQALLLQVRAGYTRPGATRPWTLPAGDAAFDAAWVSIGTSAAWQSATTTFLFPEPALDPALLDPTVMSRTSAQTMSVDFAGLCQALASGTSADLAAAVTEYVGAGDGAKPERGASARLRAVLGTRFTGLAYLSNHSMANQQALAAMSGYLDQQTQTPSDQALALEVCWAVPILVGQRLHADGYYQQALDYLWVTYPYTLSDASMIVSSYDMINNELGTDAQQPDLTLTDWRDFDPFTIISPTSANPVPPRPYPFLRASLLAIIACLVDYADAEFVTETDEAIAHARNLYRAALALLNHPRFAQPQPSSLNDGKLPIPQVPVLTSRVTTQLQKIRQDRNIAGLPRTQSLTGHPIRQPTPYHFKVLLSRAQQLTQQAVAMEGEYLTALEKYDSKTLQLVDAQNTLSVATAQLAVHDAQVQQANDAATAAKAQVTRAAAMVSTYTDAISAPPNQYEQNLLENYQSLLTAKTIVTYGDLSASIASAAASAVDTFGAGAMAIPGLLMRSVGQLQANAAEEAIQTNQLMASIQDRRQQWQIQLANAQQDQKVATDQVVTANDQVSIATAERQVATAQTDQARTTLQLLTTQFTNADLYRWLADTLGTVYRYFLQQATATAALAQAQLAFERAEPTRAIIRADYWRPVGAAPASGDARGLTGAERLSQDLAKLEQYAFSRDTRRLNLTQTFSLAQLAPVEFLGFRATGQMQFATPGILFDQDFPGHYQRLIRQARVSVVALVPPSRGIRATLSTSGISRVVTDSSSGVFGEVLLRRDSNVISFTTPVDATGVFSTDLQSDMLLPFESSGVDTVWQLSLPPAANPFDFATISDVLLTLDYTALVDPDYQAQVIRRLNTDLSRRGDRVFSLARDFPDAWYVLNNPDPTASGRSATLTLAATDFPPGITALATTDVAVRLSGSSGTANIPIGLAHGGQTPVVAPTDSTGIVSTRRGAAGPSSWGQFIGGLVAGDWHLSFDSGADPLFAAGELIDVLLVISWTGQTTPWPSD